MPICQRTRKTYSEILPRSGFKVITTCSPMNFGLVKDRGADLVLDYVSQLLCPSLNDCL